MHKIKIVVFSTYFFLLMCCYDAFASRNTSLWRQNDVFRDEKRVIAPHTLSRKKLQFWFYVTLSLLLFQSINVLAFKIPLFLTNFTTFWTSCRYSQKRRFLKTVNFSTFWNSCRYSQNRLFFVLEYGKTHFPGLYCPRKTMEKWSFLDQNHELTPFEKCQFFNFLKYLSL